MESIMEDCKVQIEKEMEFYLLKRSQYKKAYFYEWDFKISKIKNNSINTLELFEMDKL